MCCRDCLAILGNISDILLYPMCTDTSISQLSTALHLHQFPTAPTSAITSRSCLSSGQAYDNKQHFLQQFYIVNLLLLPSKQAVKVHLKALASNLFTQHGYRLE